MIEYCLLVLGASEAVTLAPCQPIHYEHVCMAMTKPWWEDHSHWLGKSANKWVFVRGGEHCLSWRTNAK